MLAPAGATSRPAPSGGESSSAAAAAAGSWAPPAEPRLAEAVSFLLLQRQLRGTHEDPRAGPAASSQSRPPHRSRPRPLPAPAGTRLGRGDRGWAGPGAGPGSGRLRGPCPGRGRGRGGFPVAAVTARPDSPRAAAAPGRGRGATVGPAPLPVPSAILRHGSAAVAGPFPRWPPAPQRALPSPLRPAAPGAAARRRGPSLGGRSALASCCRRRRPSEISEGDHGAAAAAPGPLPLLVAARPAARPGLGPGSPAARRQVARRGTRPAGNGLAVAGWVRGAAPPLPPCGAEHRDELPVPPGGEALRRAGPAPPCRGTLVPPGAPLLARALTPRQAASCRGEPGPAPCRVSGAGSTGGEAGWRGAGGALPASWLTGRLRRDRAFLGRFRRFAHRHGPSFQPSLGESPAKRAARLPPARKGRLTGFM